MMTSPCTLKFEHSQLTVFKVQSADIIDDDIIVNNDIIVMKLTAGIEE